MVAKTTITIYTDGSCLGNPGPGGWAALIKIDKQETILTGGEKNTTNNRMELKAIGAALQWLNKNSGEKTIAVINTDSNLAVQTLTKGWKKNRNQDLWREIEDLIFIIGANKLIWRWVKGHSGQLENERVDKLAKAEAFKVHQSGRKKSHNIDRKDAMEQDKQTKEEYDCPRCAKPVPPLFFLLQKSGLIKACCSVCGAYIKFARQTAENKKLAVKE